MIDLGFGVLTVPVGQAGPLLDRVLPAEDHYAAVAAEALRARILVSSRDDGPGIRACCNALGVPYVAVLR